MTRDKMQSFLNDIIEVYKKHGLSLSHEDSQGAFIIDEFKEDNVRWLLACIELHEFNLERDEKL